VDVAWSLSIMAAATLRLLSRLTSSVVVVVGADHIHVHIRDALVGEDATSPFPSRELPSLPNPYFHIECSAMNWASDLCPTFTFTFIIL